MKNVSHTDPSLLIKMGPDIGYETRDQLLKRRLRFFLWLIQTELERDRDRDQWVTVYYAEHFTLQRERDRYR